MLRGWRLARTTSLVVIGVGVWRVAPLCAIREDTASPCAAAEPSIEAVCDTMVEHMRRAADMANCVTVHQGGQVHG